MAQLQATVSVWEWGLLIARSSEFPGEGTNVPFKQNVPIFKFLQANSSFQKLWELKTIQVCGLDREVPVGDKLVHCPQSLDSKK